MAGGGTNRVIIGSRGSLLALAQTRWVARRLQEHNPGLQVELEIIRTRGDKITDVALPSVGGKGLFTAELEEALLAGQIHLAVHSAKDLPTDMPAGLDVLAWPAREDPRDALVAREARSLDDLPPGAVIGTSSTRRRAQLLIHQPDLRFTALRGNVDTRIRKVHRGDCDATLLALAGLKRVGLADHATAILAIDRMVPAPGQGALAVQGRGDDEAVRTRVEPLNDRVTAQAVACERRVAERLHGGCQVPLGVYAEVASPDGQSSRRRESADSPAEQMSCRAILAPPDASQVARAAADAPADNWPELAEQIVARLREDGADEILRRCRAF